MEGVWGPKHLSQLGVSLTTPVLPMRRQMPSLVGNLYQYHTSSNRLSGVHTARHGSDTAPSDIAGRCHCATHRRPQIRPPPRLAARRSQVRAMHPQLRRGQAACGCHSYLGWTQRRRTEGRHARTYARHAQWHRTCSMGSNARMIDS
jgi:hypothetical protein